jgi:PTS system galactitol-specific IIC component
MDATALRAKVGVFAENHIIGFILGILFGIIAGYSVAKTLMLGVQAATALVLFPMISKLFMQALSPISKPSATT